MSSFAEANGLKLLKDNRPGEDWQTSQVVNIFKSHTRMQENCFIFNSDESGYHSNPSNFLAISKEVKPLRRQSPLIVVVALIKFCHFGDFVHRSSNIRYIVYREKKWNLPFSFTYVLFGGYSNWTSSSVSDFNYI